MGGKFPKWRGGGGGGCEPSCNYSMHEFKLGVNLTGTLLLCVLLFFSLCTQFFLFSFKTLLGLSN